MGVRYSLVNFDRRHILSYDRLPVGKYQELVANPAAAALTTAYLLDHVGDRIGFVPDTGPCPFTGDEHPFPITYEDVTNRYVRKLVDLGLLIDNGILPDQNTEIPDYYRDLRLVPMLPVEQLRLPPWSDG